MTIDVVEELQSGEYHLDERPTPPPAPRPRINILATQEAKELAATQRATQQRAHAILLLLRTGR